MKENDSDTFLTLTEISLLKSRSGRYKDTPENRRLHRVGQLYGSPKQEDEAIVMRVEKTIKNAVNFERTSDAIASKTGSMVTPINVKQISSIQRKIKFEGVALEDVNDILRNTFITSQDNIENVLSEIRNNFKVVREKVQTPDKYNGYSGYLVNVQFPNGTVGEIQVNTPNMIYGKEKESIAVKLLGEVLYNKIKENSNGIVGGKGHELYEKMRVLDPFSKEFAEFQIESIEYYNSVRNINV